MPSRSTLLLAVSLFATHLAYGEPAQAPVPADDAAFFESKVRPVLVQHCYQCHSGRVSPPEGGLRLDSRAATRQGGSRGPAIVPSDSAASWLLTAVSYADSDLQMPPKGKLPEAVIADLQEWVRRGAPDPREGPASGADSAVADFWAYQPVRECASPGVNDAAWPRGDIDRFVLAKLESAGLRPTAAAAPLVLLRRLYFDLVGFPPAPDDVARFEVAVGSLSLEAALTTECDRLLEQPQFGERWGRHWLDVARFGESSGKEANISFPYAWRYRDYVIDCFAADVPYDRFLTEQLAGDLLPYETPQERARLLIATGYLAVGTKNLSEMNAAQFQADLVDEQIDTVTRSVLGSSVACARCHDHKSDPFTMRDYYALAGVFHSTKTYFGTAVSPSSNIGGDPLPLPRDAGLPIFHASLTPEQVAEKRKKRESLLREREEKTAAVWKAIAAGEDASDIFTIQDALRILWTSGSLEGELEKVGEDGRALPLAMGTLEAAQMVEAPLLARGEIGKPGESVPRAFPAALGGLSAPAIPADGSGRRELAAWLTDPSHPLTARVYVNRVWSHLLGTGLVRTVDDFGATGERPSHPELLDHLAATFVREGWSLKRLVRSIVLSRTYQQASTWNEAAFLQDPENRLLWRMPKRRLEAEAIRDAMLAASGELDRSRPQGSLVGVTIGDRPISLIGLDKRLPADLDGAAHRSVYLPVIRDRLPDVLEQFDFAEPSLVTGQRETTNVPLQALYLMNSPFVSSRAVAMARCVAVAGDDPTTRVKTAFLRAYGRMPDGVELERAVRFLLRPAAVEDARYGMQRLEDFCQALLATAEFRCVD